jgi:hypothetical protein
VYGFPTKIYSLCFITGDKLNFFPHTFRPQFQTRAESLDRAERLFERLHLVGQREGKLFPGWSAGRWELRMKKPGKNLLINIAGRISY